MAMVPSCWTHRFRVLKVVDHGTALQPKTPDYQLASEEWRGMLEDRPQTQMQVRMGMAIDFSNLLYTQMHDATARCEINDRIQITFGTFADGRDMSGQTFLVVEKGSDAAMFETFFLERLL